MKVLVDTVIWIDHLRVADPGLVSLLGQGRVVVHDHVLGELAMGSIRNRGSVLQSLIELPRTPLAEEEEARGFIEARRLFARGIGYSDAHLLASVMLARDTALWTRDVRLANVAGELGCAHRTA